MGAITHLVEENAMRIPGPNLILNRLAAKVRQAAPIAQAADAVKAVAPRVYFFHGVDAKGLSDHGRGAMDALAARFRKEGFPEAKALSYNSDNFFVNQFAVPREQLFGTFSERLTKQILDEIDRMPLLPGQKINLVGYSLGTKVAANVATALDERKIPVGVLALIEPKNGPTPPALRTLPKAEKVVLVENQRNLTFRNPFGDTFVSKTVPNKSHFEMVEQPDEGMIRYLLDQMK